MSNAIEVNDANFADEVLNSDLPVLVDFWAPWCKPCKKLTPIVEEIADEYAGKLKVVKVNIDDAPEVAQTAGIMSVPTINIYSKGEIVNSIVGAKPKEKLVEEFSSLV